MEKKTTKPRKTAPRAQKAAPKSAENKKVVKPAAAKKQAKEILPKKVSLARLFPPQGSHKSRKIKGRGPGSGHGKTSTRGSKGQTSRSGRDYYPGFEGGQTPLIRRIPKRGFTHVLKKEYQIVNLRDLSRIKESTITPELLKSRGLIASKERLVKILGEGKISAPVIVQAHAFSKKAAQEIVNAGGQAQIISVA